MEIYEGYNYRINIVGADSSIIVDSNTGYIRGCVVDMNENIMVDTTTKTFHGALIGNISDSNYNVIFDVDKNEINVSHLNSKNIKGDIVNDRGEVVYSSFHNTISSVDHIQTISLDAETFFSNTIKGNLLNNRDEVVYDGFNNTLSNIDFITSFNINSDFIESRLFSGNLQGNILDKNGKVIFDVKTNKLDLSDMLEEMIYTKNHLSFTCSKKFSFLQKTMSLIDESNPEDYQNFDFAHISIINENTFEDKDLAGMVGFYGSEPEQNNKLFFGSIGFIVNCSDEDKNKILSKNTDNEEDNVPLNLMPTDFVVINSRNNYDLLESEYVYDLIDNLLVFDANGVLSAPIIKTGVHKDLSKITKPTKGMIIFNDNINKFQGYTGTEWVDLH